MSINSASASSPRRRFIDYVRQKPGVRPVVSPFLPKPELISKSLPQMQFMPKPHRKIL
ncbi:MAG: hypothetical protein P1S60_06700 [Anaerolineae bacterium]|nr:hypothetical protein [Anaerolineae bacterium]